jgi:type I restriction enzyme, S subunit
VSFTASLDEIVEVNADGLLAKHPSWCRVKLSEVAAILNGFPFPSERFSRDVGTPLLRIRDILSEKTESRFEGLYDPAYIVEPGDLVVGMDGDFNAALWKGPQALLNQRVCKITPNEGFCSKKFLFYVLPGYLKVINEYTSSITVKHLSSKTIADIPLPLPPRAEQDRIVEELERNITRIDAATKSLQRVKKALGLYRTSILRAACDGRLVRTEAELAREEGRGYETAEEFLYRLSEINGRKRPTAMKGKTDSPLPEGWSWATLPELGELSRGKSKHRPRNDPSLLGGSFPFIQTSEVKHSQGWIRRFTSTYNDKGLAQSRLWPSGTLCITIAANIAETGILIFPACFPDSVVGFLPKGEPATVRYVELFIRTIKAEIHQFAPATAQKNINLDILGEVLLPLPPSAEQRRIVAEVDRHLSFIVEIESTVEACLKRSAGLRTAIFRKAFQGRFVPQDDSDEPAPALLARIRKEWEERAASRAQPPRGRGIKPGPEAMCSGAVIHPKIRRGDGIVRDSVSASEVLQDESNRCGPELKSRALDFLALARDEQTHEIWETLVGRGAIAKGEAIRIAAHSLRDKGFVVFQRLRQGGSLYKAISAAIERGVREGSFDRPRRGFIRALLPDSRTYEDEDWRRCILASLDHGDLPEDEVLHSGAEWARENMGLEFARLREGGIILRGLRMALKCLMAEGSVTKTRSRRLRRSEL